MHKRLKAKGAKHHALSQFLAITLDSVDHYSHLMRRKKAITPTAIATIRPSAQR